MSIIKLEKYKIIFKDKNNYIIYKIIRKYKKHKKYKQERKIHMQDNFVKHQMGRNRETFLSYNKMKGA